MMGYADGESQIRKEKIILHITFFSFSV